MKKLTNNKKICRAGKLSAALAFLLAAVMLLAVCAGIYIVGGLMTKSSRPVSLTSANKQSLPVIVIDAGHGGIDSGAVGANGAFEKDINLAVAVKLRELFRLSGVECVMTRTEDAMLVDDGIRSHRKMHDLKNRLAVVDEITDSGREAVLVSIHMNNFSGAKYSGLQVWYSGNDERGAHLASFIQSYARTWLDPDNKRETKRATSAIYLLDRAKFPAVLVECGFLSNAKECERLCSDTYQTKLAVTIFAAVCDWITSSTK